MGLNLTRSARRRADAGPQTTRAPDVSDKEEALAPRRSDPWVSQKSRDQLSHDGEDAESEDTEQKSAQGQERADQHPTGRAE